MTYDCSRSVFLGNLPFDVQACAPVMPTPGCRSGLSLAVTALPHTCLQDEEVITLFQRAATQLGVSHGVQAVRLVSVSDNPSP